MIDINLRQEKMDEMREDMLIEIKLRNDDDYFYDHLSNKFDNLVQEFHNECQCYDREPYEWFVNMLEK